MTTHFNTIGDLGPETWWRNKPGRGLSKRLDAVRDSGLVKDIITEEQENIKQAIE